MTSMRSAALRLRDLEGDDLRRLLELAVEERRSDSEYCRRTTDEFRASRLRPRPRRSSPSSSASSLKSRSAPTVDVTWEEETVSGFLRGDTAGAAASTVGLTATPFAPTFTLA